MCILRSGKAIALMQVKERDLRNAILVLEVQEEKMRHELIRKDSELQAAICSITAIQNDVSFLLKK